MDKAPVERNGSTRSDKLITDYLSRHSASAASKSVEGHSSRHPLAALENLQAALSNLSVAYDFDKPAENAESKPMAMAHSGPAGSDALQHAAEATSSEVQVIRSNDIKAQSSRLQSHPIQCSPVPETACCSYTGKVQLDSNHPACCLFQHDPAGSTAPHLTNSPSTPLQTDNHSSILGRTEQSTPLLTSTSTFAGQDRSSSDDCLPGALPAAAASTPAALQHTPDYTPTVYCTPYDSSPTYAHYTMAESPPANVKERWYTPGTNLDTCDPHGVSTQLTECAFSPSHSLSRPDSPSLLYGQGSAFSADMLGKENDISSQWLTR